MLQKQTLPQRHRVTEKRNDQSQPAMPTNSYPLYSNLSLCLRVSVAKLSLLSGLLGGDLDFWLYTTKIIVDMVIQRRIVCALSQEDWPRKIRRESSQRFSQS